DRHFPWCSHDADSTECAVTSTKSNCFEKRHGNHATSMKYAQRKDEITRISCCGGTAHWVALACGHWRGHALHRSRNQNVRRSIVPYPAYKYSGIQDLR